MKTNYRAQPLEGPGHYQIIDESCLQIALVRHWPDLHGVNTDESRKTTKDRAEFIVKACNSHAQLVAALEGMIEQADAQFRAGDRHATFNKQTIEQVRQALQSAKE